MKGNDEFAEISEFSGNLYGTSWDALEVATAEEKVVVKDFCLEGVRQLKAMEDLDAVYVYIKPPTVAVLESRLRGRATESEEQLKRRLEIAEEELEDPEVEGLFDYVVVNADKNEAYAEVRGIVKPLIDQLGDL